VETGVGQTKLSNVLKPSNTIFLAENDPNSTLGGLPGPAESVTTAYYSVARHSHNTRGNFSMVDGSAVSARTNDFWEPQNMADGDPSGTGATEWAQARTMYWYPSPTTPN